jgi:hypothetical protein
MTPSDSVVLIVLVSATCVAMFYNPVSVAPLLIALVRYRLAARS